jgi:hypothetical protein
MISMQRIKVGLHRGVFSAAGVDGRESVGDGDDDPGASVLVANNDDLGIGAYGGGGGGRLLMHDVNNPLWPGTQIKLIKSRSTAVMAGPTASLPSSRCTNRCCAPWVYYYIECTSIWIVQIPYRSMTCTTLDYTITCSL